MHPSRSQHEHIISGDKIDGGWVSRSQRCGAWPSKLCHHILAVVEHILGWDPPKHVLTVVDGVDGSLEGRSVLPYEVFVEEQEHHHGHEHGHDTPETENQKQTRETDSLVYKLHRKFGHPSYSHLATPLRLGVGKTRNCWSSQTNQA